MKRQDAPILIVEDADEDFDTVLETLQASGLAHPVRRAKTGCYEYGANAYHVKPVRYVEHLAILKDVLAYWLNHVTLPPGFSRSNP